MRGLLLPCYVIEVLVVLVLPKLLLLPWYVIEVLVEAQQEMVYAAEDGGIYVRRLSGFSSYLQCWLDFVNQLILLILGRQGSTDWLEGKPEDWCWKREAGTVSIVKR